MAPFLRPKRKVPLRRKLHLVNDVLSKTDYSERASTTASVKKKKNKIRVCKEFSTDMYLETYAYPPPSSEDIRKFGRMFSKLHLSGVCSKTPEEKECTMHLTINTHNGLYIYHIAIRNKRHFPTNHGYVIE